ncbi:hypothetical protein SLEP1_g53186 [Rubroshorea leprosula]|uniref:Uncharacterized protein n=1 Tax=Rubroshorea leprosula TaxID=152421 RepID=A0AAV5M8N1_9ROSI|nr:hypothetical protein SLEP1_g53186 [Rubroshorea leprosula]
MFQGRNGDTKHRGQNRENNLFEQRTKYFVCKMTKNPSLIDLSKKETLEGKLGKGELV